MGFSKVFFIHLKLFFMKNFLLTAMLLGSKAVFGQVLGLSGFEVFDDGSYMLTVKTEKEAVERYRFYKMRGSVIGWVNMNVTRSWHIIFESFTYYNL